VPKPANVMNEMDPQRYFPGVGARTTIGAFASLGERPPSGKHVPAEVGKAKEFSAASIDVLSLGRTERL
jgi:hypothetical protein